MTDEDGESEPRRYALISLRAGYCQFDQKLHPKILILHLTFYIHWSTVFIEMTTEARSSFFFSF